MHPDWLIAERVIAKRGAGREAAFLVKWRGLPYAEATWEAAARLGSPEDNVRQYTRCLQMYTCCHCLMNAKLVRSVPAHVAQDSSLEEIVATWVSAASKQTGCVG